MSVAFWPKEKAEAPEAGVLDLLAPKRLGAVPAAGVFPVLALAAALPKLKPVDWPAGAAPKRGLLAEAGVVDAAP